MGAEGMRKQRPMRGRDANPPRPLEDPANVTVKAHEENSHNKVDVSSAVWTHTLAGPRRAPCA